MNASLAKALGWLQFAAQTVGTVFAHGFPTTLAGWLPPVISLITAASVHAAANTDGVK